MQLNKKGSLVLQYEVLYEILFAAPQHAMIAVSHTPQPPPPPPPPPRNLPAEAEVSSGARRGGTSPSNRSSPIAVLGLVIILLLKTQRCR